MIPEVTVEDFGNTRDGRVVVLRAGSLLVALDCEGRFVTCAVYGMVAPEVCKKPGAKKSGRKPSETKRALMANLIAQGMSRKEVASVMGWRGCAAYKNYAWWVKKLGALPKGGAFQGG